MRTPVSILLLVLSIISVQVGASLAKKLFSVLGPSGVCVVRIATASLILCVAWRAWRFRPTASQLRLVVLYGASLGAMNLTYYLALQRLPIGLTVALEFLGPLTIALFYSKRALDFLWAGLAALGLFLILPFNGGATSWSGIALALCAGAAWSCYVVFGKRASAVVHNGVSTSLGMLAALCTVAPFSSLEIGKLSGPVLAMGIAVGILSSALPYSLEMIVLRHIPAKNFGILQSLSPAIAALAGFVVLHETLSAVQVTALVCILAASFGSAWSIEREVPPLIEV